MWVRMDRSGLTRSGVGEKSLLYILLGFSEDGVGSCSRC